MRRAGQQACKQLGAHLRVRPEEMRSRLRGSSSSSPPCPRAARRSCASKRRSERAAMRGLRRCLELPRSVRYASMRVRSSTWRVGRRRDGGSPRAVPAADRQARVRTEVRPGLAPVVDILHLEPGLRRGTCSEGDSVSPPASARSSSTFAGHARRYGLADILRGRSPWRPGRAPCGSRPGGTGSPRSICSLPGPYECRRGGRGSAGRSGTPCGGARRSRGPCRRSCRGRRAARGRAAGGTASGSRSGAAEQRVDVGHVDAFVEEVDGEEDVDRAGARSRSAARRSASGLSRPDRDGRDAGLAEDACHEPRVLDADAEPEAPHRREIVDVRRRAA